VQCCAGLHNVAEKLYFFILFYCSVYDMLYCRVVHVSLV